MNFHNILANEGDHAEVVKKMTEFVSADKISGTVDSTILLIGLYAITYDSNFSSSNGSIPLSIRFLTSFCA